MFPIVLLNAKTKTGLELALKCVRFAGSEDVNSEDPILKFEYAVCEQSLEPFRKIQSKNEQGELLFEEDGTTPIFLPPTLEDYYYETLSDGYKDYSNQTLRQDLEVVDGVPQPKMIQATDEFGNPAFLPQLDVNGDVVTIPEVIPAVIVDDIEVEPERTIDHVQYTTDPVMVPVMIGNIDFWLKWGGQGIIADLYFTAGQIKQEPLEAFYK